MQVDEATEGRVLRKRKEKIPKHLKREANEKEMDGFTKRVLRIPVEKHFDEVNIVELGKDLGYIAACHCGAEYETEYSESIDTHTITSIDSNGSPTTDELYSMSLDRKQPVDHSTSTDQYYPDFAFQQPNKNGRDDYSIGNWADSGFHESFAVETVILSSNEDPTEEYDEDYWKERATEIAMQDERYSTHSLNNTTPPSIDNIYSASVDTHPYPAKRFSTSIDTTPGTSIDIKAAALEKEKGNIPIPNRCMSISTRSNKEKHLLFSKDPAHLERTIRKDQRLTLLDATAFTSTDSRTHPSTDTRPSSSTNPHRSTSIDSTPRTSIDPQSRSMVAIVILRQDENGDLYDQDAVPEATRKNTCYSKKILLTWNTRSAKINVPHRSTQQAFTSTDSRTQRSTDTRPSSSTDLHSSTSIDSTPRTSIDPQSRNMVPIVILRQDENGDLYDQDGHLRSATVVKHEKLGEGDFEVESSMSFGGSHWCRPMSIDAHRSTDHDEDRSIDCS
ncbi:hypothetical protein F2Q69_00007146 [Brassica cretica]|uniref:Uncharacterized protein n=1 Tax=Brassica cretica TaxID=69181 RepID=A0A8S9PHY5_BRACR|nr:hypothetical protein F2Q69_00007146 [Brassica cretica]